MYVDEKEAYKKYTTELRSCMAWRGPAWPGEARLGRVRRGRAGRGKETFNTEKTQMQSGRIQVTLTGLAPVLFDRYPGDNTTSLPVEQKMYFRPGTQELCLPALNLISFLSAKNTQSMAKFIGGKSYSKLASALLAYVTITPALIPFHRAGKPIIFYGFHEGVDAMADIRIVYHVARLARGVPNPKERPALATPWELSFQIVMIKNTEFDITFLHQAFIQGGIMLGVGTFRGVYGKFEVTEWTPDAHLLKQHDHGKTRQGTY